MGKKILHVKIYPLDFDLSKMWFIRYYTPQNGKLKKVRARIPRKLATVDARLHWAKEFIYKLENDIVEVVENSANRHILRLKEILSEKKNISTNTRCSYLGHINLLNTYCKDNKIRVITEGVAVGFLDWARLSREGRTVNQYRRSLYGLFEVLRKNKEIKKNPFANTERFETKKPFSENWKDSDIDLIVEKVKERKPFMLLPMLLILHCATRNGREMPNLKVKDIDFERALLWIDNEYAKNGEKECVKLPASLMAILQHRQIDKMDKDFYLLTKSGVPGPTGVGKNFFNRHFKEILNELGINKRGKGFYRLKNSLAHKLVTNKVNTFAIQKQFRHKSIVTTEKYLASLCVDDFPELTDFSFF